MRSNGIYDLVVVGGGPAGCCAARVAAERGLSVLLLEKERFPRWKPCAGGLTPKALDLIPQALHPLLEATIYAAHLTFGNDRDRRVRRPAEVGWTVHRERFDQEHFAHVAALPGVEGRTGWPVSGIEEGAESVRVSGPRGEVRGRVVIGADGVKGVVSRAVRPGARRRIGVAFEGEARFEDPLLPDEVLFDFRWFPGGYGWIFPKRDHYSLGGYFPSGAASGLRRLYETFERECRWLDGTVTYRTRGYGVPQGGSRGPFQRGRALLAGDAADTVDPLTGEGIAFALRSGALAAETAADFLEGEGELDGYTKRLWREIHADLRWAGWLASLVYGRPALAYRYLWSRRIAAEAALGVLSGELTYRRLLRRLPGAILRRRLPPSAEG